MTVIYGFVGQRTGIEAGEFLGPSRLVEKKVRELTKDFLGFLQAFNSMLRDYAGAEIFSLEFELVNFATEIVDTRLYPKSMLLLPGKYKDAENLLVALRSDQSGMDSQLAHVDMDHICRLCWEIEEVTENPSLGKEHKSQLMAKFVQRFARRIQGLLIEGKWNKKLIGMKGKGPTDSEDLATISTVKAMKRVRWDAPAPVVETFEPSYTLTVPNFLAEKLGEFYKVMISGPSAHFISQNTFKLAANLLHLANLGSVNDNQAQIIQFALKIILENITKLEQVMGPQESIQRFLAEFDHLFTLMNEFQTIGIKFTQEGFKGSLPEILTECAKFFAEKDVPDKKLIQKILDIFIESCKQESAYKIKAQMRSSDLKTDMQFFVESSKMGLEVLKDNLYFYFSLLLQREFLNQFGNAIKKMLATEAKPAKELGLKFLEKIQAFIARELAYEHYYHLTYKQPNIPNLPKKFSEFIRDNVPKYFEDLDVTVADLLSFAVTLVDEETAPLKDHVTKLSSFEHQIEFVHSYILRYSSLNRFLIEFEDQIQNPASFATLFYEFLRKRISGLVNSGVFWGAYMLEWVLEFRDKFSSKIDARRWEKGEIVKEFLHFLEEKMKSETNIKNFLYIMDKYAGNLPPNTRPAAFTQLMQRFEESISIEQSFPEYLKGRIAKQLEEIHFEFVPRRPAEYFQKGDQPLYYEFLENHALKHFARLQALPKALILRSTASKVDHREVFYIFEFQYLQKRLKIDVKTNWVTLAKYIK
ncbi:MAG: hypothetical protein RBG13Loki_0272 [Promethearchaeota archaeon CR_4]|nr:MAG: hypothetical protein RBG13Loki_0272 [Candidatus Lokiarchaeota archaeon CR_4]